MLWGFKYEINIAQDVNANINDTEADYSFTMAVPYNAGTGYHWEISPESMV